MLSVPSSTKAGEFQGELLATMCRLRRGQQTHLYLISILFIEQMMERWRNWF